MFIMARKTTFLEKRKECTQTFKRMTRLNMRGYSDKMIDKNLLEVKTMTKKNRKKKKFIMCRTRQKFQPKVAVWSVRIQDSKSPPNNFKLELCTSSL